MDTRKLFNESAPPRTRQTEPAPRRVSSRPIQRRAYCMSIPLKAPHHDVWLAPLDPSKLPGAKSRVLRFTSSIRPLQTGPSRSARLLLGTGIVLAALATYGVVRWLVR